MSRYYKAEDIIAFLNLHCPKDMWEYQIADLPTIEVSEDAISRAEAIECISELPLDEVIIKQALKTLPSVIPKPKEGEWIIDEPEEIGYGTIYECPYCKYEVEFVPTNYCPNCGSRMKGEE